MNRTSLERRRWSQRFLDLAGSSPGLPEEATLPEGLQEPEFPPQGQWTYEDYRGIPDDGRRYEVLRGVLYASAVPSPLHQLVLRDYVRLLVRFLDQKPVGDFFFAPLDLILPRGLSAPVQPDLFFCLGEWKGRITSQYMEGVPDLILEVLSPSTRRYDRRTKLDVYAAAGVQEYWIADPLKRTVEVLALRNGSYESLGLFEDGGKVRSEVLPGFEPAVDQIFLLRRPSDAL